MASSLKKSPISNNKSLQLLIQLPNHQTKTLTLTNSNSISISDLKSLIFPNSINPNSISLSFDGKTLINTLKLNTLPFRQCSTLIARVRTLGGGGDGGATGAESRDCYLNMYAEKKPDAVDPNEKRVSKWTNCALSHEPLSPPCVIDRLGNLFNKETLVKSILGKNIPKHFSYIKGLKDMINVNLTETGDLSSEIRFQCPITGLEFNGKYKFYVLVNCGHVLSAKALKEIKSSSCLVCYKEIGDDLRDKIVVNGSEEEVAVLREELEKEKPKKKVRKVEKDDGGRKGKKFKAVDIAPEHANKEVYASIFISSRKSEFKETYSCRSLPLGRN